MRRGLAWMAALAVACGGDDTGSADTAPTDDGAETGDPGPPMFPGIGQLVGAEGRGRFRFGAASSATQIEDLNPTVDWYVWTAPDPDGLGNGPFIDDAARGFTLAQDDVELLEALQLDAYRFSIEWARVEPERDEVDEDALAHYDALIDALVARGIRPLVTLHHFSNPIWIDDPRDPDCEDGPNDDNLCGWNHHAGGPAVAEEFAEHAALIAERFGDRVDEWATINEPVSYVMAAYGAGLYPPGKTGVLGDFDGLVISALRNLIAGHAAAYAEIKQFDAADADGDGVPAAVGLTSAAIEFVAARGGALSENPDDIAARDRIDYLYHRLVVDAAREGAFDPDLDGTLDEPHPDWAGTIDWLGVQYYLRAGVTADPGLVPLVAATPCLAEFDSGSCVPPLDDTYAVPTTGYEHDPAGLYNRLFDFGTRYPGLPLLVTESGIASADGVRRAEVIVRAIEGIERARVEGIDVRGYYHFSLYDNFALARGFDPRFGLFRVDYESYARSPSDAVAVYAGIVAARNMSNDVRLQYGGPGPLSPEP